jgi:hypothetical protein
MSLRKYPPVPRPPERQSLQHQETHQAAPGACSTDPSFRACPDPAVAGEGAAAFPGGTDLLFRSAAFACRSGRAADLEGQVCATRVLTSEATTYMKTKYRSCKTNCLGRTMPHHRGHPRNRLCCEFAKANQAPGCPDKAVVARTCSLGPRLFRAGAEEPQTLKAKSALRVSLYERSH